jgi:soluble lytic murein transglycosylase-like protein
MSRSVFHVGASLVLFTLLASAWAEEARYTVPAASVEDQFSAYHQDLSDAADQLLAAATRDTSTMQPKASPEVRMLQPDADTVRRFAQKYWNNEPESVRRAVERVTQLRPVLDPILHEEGIPRDVAALVLIESGGRAAALSPKGARGIWQFMPDTARRYGLMVDATRDERLDVVKSTRAAAHYLRDLHRQFGDWQLSFAAYNAGEAAVHRAVSRAGQTEFTRLQRLLPQETRSYVAAAVSAVDLVNAGSAKQIKSPASGRVLYASTEGLATPVAGSH